MVAASVTQAGRTYAIVPTLFAGATLAILAGGPSLTAADVDACRGRVPVIAIKDAVRLAPWADVLYACDRKWWKAYPATADFEGPKFGLEDVPGRPDVGVLRYRRWDGLELDPTYLSTGHNSGYQAINLAVHLGARRIVLLGYDMQPAGGRHHWFGAHPYTKNQPPYELFLRCFDTLPKALAPLGIEVLNATPGSALAVFPKVTLAEALA